MNDTAGHPVELYKKTTQAMVDAVRKARPDTEFILIATMLGNRDWIALHHERFPQFRDALAELCGPGVALADMTSMWTELFKYKKDWDMTGNGVNHPNDFGHRVYAEVFVGAADSVGNAGQGHRPLTASEGLGDGMALVSRRRRIG